MIASPLAARLGLTLLHGMWQIAALGLITWCLLATFRSASPRVRYRIALGSFLGMALLPVATYLGMEGGSPHTLMLTLDAAVSGNASTQGHSPWLVWAGISSWAGTLAPWLAWGWVFGVTLRFTHLAASMAWLQWVVSQGSREPSRQLESRFLWLRARFGVSRRVHLKTCARVTTPMVVGWWRPIILMPVAAVLHLTPACLEAVLAHELAHIRRHDPLVNLLQAWVETLLFFHPVAWWLSREVRELREQCCDDEAVAFLKDPLPLAEGLAALARLGHAPSNLLEPALAAVKGPLMNRITRLFVHSTSRLPALSGVAWGLAGLLVAGALAAQAANHAPIPVETAPVLESSDQPAPVNVEYTQLTVKSRPKSMNYPLEARKKGVQGTVKVEMVIDAHGVPTSTRAVEGPEELREASIAYCQGWRFHPFKKQGTAVSAKFQMVVNFRLSK